MKTPTVARLAVCLLLASYVVLAVGYSALVPLWENPDEPEHMLYIRYLATHRALPEEPLLASFTINDEGGQAPLYYAIAAAMTSKINMSELDSLQLNPRRTWVGDPGRYAMFQHTRDEAWPWQGLVLAAHLVRLLSVVFGAVTVLGVYLVARMAFPGNPIVALIAMSLTVFNPGFIASTSNASNDSLVAATSTVVLVLIGRATVRAPKSLLALSIGGALGIALLSKADALLLVPFALAPCVWIPGLRSKLGYSLKVLVACVAISGWWYAWNWIVFGTPIRKEAGRMIIPEAGWESNLSFQALAGKVAAMFQSFWGFVGFTDVKMDGLVYLALAALSALAVSGLILIWRERNGSISGQEARFPLLLVVAFAAFSVLILYRSSLTPWPGLASARFLLPVISATTTLFSVGLVLMARKLRMRWTAPAAVAGLACLSVVAPFAYIVPVYPAPLPVWYGSPPIAEASHLSVSFGDDISLVGFDGPASVHPGDSLRINLYWQCTRRPDRTYTAFVHLLSANGGKLTQSDQVAVESYQTERWRAGETIVDERSLAIPPGTSPGVYRIGIGMYSWPSLSRLTVVDRGALPPDNIAIVAEISVD